MSGIAPSTSFPQYGILQANPIYEVDKNGNPRAANTFSIPAGTTTDTVVKSSAGTFYGMLITTSAAGTPTVYDNATSGSGTPISIAPASTVGFTATPYIGVNCALGITVKGSASNPAITVYWA
jgi:hypothetical protein